MAKDLEEWTFQVTIQTSKGSRRDDIEMPVTDMMFEALEGAPFPVPEFFDIEDIWVERV